MTFKLTPLSTIVVAAQSAEEVFEIGSSQVRILSDRNIHVKVGAGVTEDDFPIRADQAEFLTGFAAETELSIIKGAGETDGTVWISKVSIQ